MSKEITNHFQLKDVCRSAGLWYIGSFMGEFLEKRELWQNPKTKAQFIAYMHNMYGYIDSDITGTRTRVNCVIRIIESRKVEEALRLVLQANDDKLGCPDSKINARLVLQGLSTGEYHY